jgi:hypothetical protein
MSYELRQALNGVSQFNLQSSTFAFLAAATTRQAATASQIQLTGMALR